MRTPFGRIGWISVLLVAAVVATIITGMIVPGRAGKIIQVVGWVALAGGVIFEVGLGTLGLRATKGEEWRPLK